MVAICLFSGRIEGLNARVKVTIRKPHGFRELNVLKMALFHQLGNLPEYELTHRFCYRAFKTIEGLFEPGLLSKMKIDNLSMFASQLYEMREHVIKLKDVMEIYEKKYDCPID